ncbi:hypothetical protein FH608_028305 [Nonomuraea phyllanthi]|uniref:Transmembrane protein n=1 Tax=Nonomuraea phyllanthi TaxID=2219224 RepID=A0A5C4W3Z9_9ACTN|nr:hypothetical protein [Nonomuraea phyllanthi]KAB8191860.1 hypothetical protein FH608_028305 [Nonomuraea phyllanthi]
MSVTVGVALALAVAQPLERLTTGTDRIAGLLALALLLGCNRAVGMGIGSLLVFLIWLPNLVVMLWFVVPLLVVSVVAIGMSGRTKQLIDLLDVWDGPTPWTILLLITAGGAVAWAIWSWSGWASAAVLLCVLTWAQWFRLTGTVPVPWRLQIRRQEWSRWLVVAYLVFSPIGGAVVAELAEFRPMWVLIVAMPILVGVAMATFPAPHPAYPWVIPGGVRVRQVLGQGGLFAALLAARFPDSPATPALLTTVAAGAAVGAVTMWWLRAAPFHQLVTQDLVQMEYGTESVFDEWARRAIVRRRLAPDAGLLTMLIVKAGQSLDNKAPTMKALLDIAQFSPQAALSRASDPFGTWTTLVDQAVSAVDRCAGESGREMDRLLALLRVFATQPALAEAMRSRNLEAVGRVLAEQTEHYGRSGLTILRDESRLLEARFRFGNGDDAGAIAIVEEVLAQPDLDVYNRRDALVLLTVSSVLDGDADAVAEYREVSAGLRVRWSDRRRIWVAARAMRPFIGPDWLRIPLRVRRVFRDKHLFLTSEGITPQLALDLFDLLSAKSRIAGL